MKLYLLVAIVGIAFVACRPTTIIPPAAKRRIDPHPHLKWLAATYRTETRGRRFIAQWEDRWIQEVADSGSKMQDYLVLVIPNDDSMLEGSEVISVWTLTGTLIDGMGVNNMVVVPDGVAQFRIVGMPVR